MSVVLGMGNGIILGNCLRLSGVVGNASGIPTRSWVHAHSVATSNLWQVVYSHCLPSLLSFKQLGYKREYSDWTDL